MSRKLKFNENTKTDSGTLHEHLCTFMIPRRIHRRMKNVSDKSCRENENTHFVFSKFSRKPCLL